jgi:putative hydrolase of the HAD superfamily
MKFEAVIFDLFGTIVDGFASSSAGYQEQFAAALAVPHDQLAPHWRDLTDRRTLGEFQTVEGSIEHLCNLIGITVSAEQMLAAVETRLNLTRHALKPRSDALATFTRLKSAGVKLGLLSNCSIEIPIVWPETELARLFDAAVFSSRERIKKPAAEMYQLICARLEVTANNCLYVADGENFELAAAAAVGMHAVLIRSNGLDSKKEVLREAREWEGPTVSQLTDLLTLAEIGD